MNSQSSIIVDLFSVCSELYAPVVSGILTSVFVIEHATFSPGWCFDSIWRGASVGVYLQTVTKWGGLAGHDGKCGESVSFSVLFTRCKSHSYEVASVESTYLYILVHLKRI